MEPVAPGVEFIVVGVVLAGGKGTRLRPMTRIVNKHLLPVYDRPVIEYPISTLRAMGCDDIIIVSGGEHIGGFAEYLGNGYTYRVQDEAGGIAQALACVKGLVDGIFPVILGDNYFSDTPEMPNEPTIYIKSVERPNAFGVYANRRIIEKPDNPLSDKAVVGLYVYDERVFDIIETLTPSARGELEITDVNNAYLDMGASAVEYHGFWLDMGTFDSLLEVANYVR